MKERFQNLKIRLKSTLNSYLIGCGIVANVIAGLLVLYSIYGG